MFADWSAERMIAVADDALALAKELGVQPERNNRLERARDNIRSAEKWNVQIALSDPDMERRLSEAYKTVFEQQLILKTTTAPNAAELKHLKLMLRGDDLPAEIGDDPARDKQTESLAAALFRTAGYVVRHAEPDLVISGPTPELGVAIKRVKSNRQYKARVKEANRQLRAHGRPGFIIVNPELLLSSAYFADRSTDVSRLLFDKTLEWINFLD